MPAAAARAFRMTCMSRRALTLTLITKTLFDRP